MKVLGIIVLLILAAWGASSLTKRLKWIMTLRRLKSGGPADRVAAAKAVSKIWNCDAFDALTAALQDRDPSVRSEVTLDLANMDNAKRVSNWRLGDRAPWIVPHLIKALKDPEPKVRSNAAWAVKFIGMKGISALADSREPLARSPYCLFFKGREHTTRSRFSRRRG